MTLEDFTNLTSDYGPTVTMIVVTIIAITLLIKAWPAIAKTVLVVNEVAELPQTIYNIEKEIKEIKKEVLPNGGTSLRDAVNRTENQLKIVSRLVAKHEKEINH